QGVIGACKPRKEVLEGELDDAIFAADFGQVIDGSAPWPSNLRCIPMENRNNVRKLREARMWSKIELARRAGISPLTIDRIEKGIPSGIMTRGKIFMGLELKVSQRYRFFKK